MEDMKTLMAKVNKQHLSIHPTPTSNEESDKKKEEFICLSPVLNPFLDIVFGAIFNKSRNLFGLFYKFILICRPSEL